MSLFDPRLEAPATLKERFMWVIFMGVLFFILYGAANQYAYIGTPHLSLFMEWERSIPFVPPFIIPYMSSDLMFCGAFLLIQSRLELRVLALRVLAIVTFSVIIFTLFPLQFGFVKPKTDEYEWLFNLLSADLPYNQLPSLHISFAIILWASMRNHISNPFVKYSIAIWFWLIALSTLLVYQHHFIDIPTGALVGVMAILLIDKESIFLQGFTTPRSLKVGLYYLMIAILALAMAFAYYSLISLWLFVSMMMVSVAYGFGFNYLIAGKHAHASWWQWIIFAPYFIGTNLSWRFYKRNLPLMTQVENKVYFGRYPAASEYQILSLEGINYVINLALEHQIIHSTIQQIRLPFLDLTIPSPESLHHAVGIIESRKDSGVYIHCALGLSRSVMVIGAWMLYQGYTLEEFNQRMHKIRPDYVKSAYLIVALTLYREFLCAGDKYFD